MKVTTQYFIQMKQYNKDPFFHVCFTTIPGSQAQAS